MKMNKFIRQRNVGADHGQEHIDPGIRMGASPVILSVAKDLAAHRDRPFAEFTLSEMNVLRACPERSEGVTV